MLSYTNIFVCQAGRIMERGRIYTIDTLKEIEYKLNTSFRPAGSLEPLFITPSHLLLNASHFVTCAYLKKDILTCDIVTTAGTAGTALDQYLKQNINSIYFRPTGMGIVDPITKIVSNYSLSSIDAWKTTSKTLYPLVIDTTNNDYDRAMQIL